MMKSEGDERNSLGRFWRKLLSPKGQVERKRFLPSAVDSEDVASSSSSSGSQLEVVFNYMDENGDGKISAAELRNCVKMVGGELSAEEAEAAVRFSDLDGDGFLDLNEFHKLMEGEGRSVEDKKSELKEAFEMYVVEGNDCITATSLKRMLRRLGQSSSIDDCKAMIRAFDLNGDGVLSFDEFALMMH